MSFNHLDWTSPFGVNFLPVLWDFLVVYEVTRLTGGVFNLLVKVFGGDLALTLRFQADSFMKAFHSLLHLADVLLDRLIPKGVD